MKYLPLFLLAFFCTVTSTTAQNDSPVETAAAVDSTGTMAAGAPLSAFAEVKEGEFVIGGRPFRFVGSNAYHLATYQKLKPSVVDETLDAYEEAGVSVVRTWGFYDGYDCGYSAEDSSENVIQTAPGEYSEEALRNLDKVIAKGKEHGIRFILTFSNYWDELGGICQYNTWAGAEEPSENMHFFMNNEDTQRWFRDYISMLTNRVNTETGVAYKDEPAIFSWEIMNEANHKEGDKDPKPLRDWYQEIAQHIKSEDPNHMVSTGEEGQESDMDNMLSPYSRDQYSNTFVLRSGNGTSFKMNTAIPEIDYATAHWYPSGWGFGHEANEDVLKAQRAWISDHIRLADEENKPFVLGEYGFPGWGDERVETIYSALWKQAEEQKLDGSLLWQFTPGHTKCYEYGGNICWPGGRADETLYESFKEHINTIHNLQ